MPNTIEKRHTAGMDINTQKATLLLSTEKHAAWLFGSAKNAMMKTESETVTNALRGTNDGGGYYPELGLQQSDNRT